MLPFIHPIFDVLPYIDSDPHLPSNTQKNNTFRMVLPYPPSWFQERACVWSRKNICPKSANITESETRHFPMIWVSWYIIIVLVMKRYTKSNIVFVIKHGTHAVSGHFRRIHAPSCPMLGHSIVVHYQRLSTKALQAPKGSLIAKDLQRRVAETATKVKILSMSTRKHMCCFFFLQRKTRYKLRVTIL